MILQVSIVNVCLQHYIEVHHKYLWCRPPFWHLTLISPANVPTSLLYDFSSSRLHLSPYLADELLLTVAMLSCEPRTVWLNFTGLELDHLRYLWPEAYYNFRCSTTSVLELSHHHNFIIPETINSHVYSSSSSSLGIQSVPKACNCLVTSSTSTSNDCAMYFGRSVLACAPARSNFIWLPISPAA